MRTLTRAEPRKLTIVVPGPEAATLQRLARRGLSGASTLAGRLLSRALRAYEHPAIELTPAPDGTCVARLAGRRVAVWVLAERARKLNPAEQAKELHIPEPLIQAALDYAAAYPEDIAEDAVLGQRSLAECGLQESTPPKK